MMTTLCRTNCQMAATGSWPSSPVLTGTGTPFFLARPQSRLILLTYRSHGIGRPQQGTHQRADDLKLTVTPQCRIAFRYRYLLLASYPHPSHRAQSSRGPISGAYRKISPRSCACVTAASTPWATKPSRILRSPRVHSGSASMRSRCWATLVSIMPRTRRAPSGSRK